LPPSAEFENQPKTMAQPPPNNQGSAAARAALAQKLSGVPPDYFVIKLYQMLQEQKEVLTWDPDGGIIIHDRQRLEASLSIYFRHNRFTSFQRQLNNFGFHKKRKPTACLSGTAAQQRKGAAYDHPLLVGQAPEAVLRLRRDARPRQPRATTERRATARQRSSTSKGAATFNLLADVAATELRRENSRCDLLVRSASSSEDHEDPQGLTRNKSSLSEDSRGASSSPPRVSDSEGRSCSAGSQDRSERSSSRDSGSDDDHRQGSRVVGGARPWKRAPQKPFPVLLKDMLDATADSILAWSPDGAVFEIRDAEVLQRDVLPKFFRHARLASFQRQLSLYQFRRARATPGSPAPLSYAHPHFSRHADAAALRGVARAAPKPPQPTAPPPPLAAARAWPRVRPREASEESALTALFALSGVSGGGGDASPKRQKVADFVRVVG
jgi:hypothetical protein